MSYDGSFNPRAHVGRDPRGDGGYGCFRVSIHAPTWGATHEERDQILHKWFQSTRPRGARPLGELGARGVSYGFNPRAHVGRDPIGVLRC